MKLEKILDQLNSFDKNPFLKILDSIIDEKPSNYKEIDKILSSYSTIGLKNADSHIIDKVFSQCNEEFLTVLRYNLQSTVSQLDILIDILIKDGNCIMSREWLAKLYEKEIIDLRKKTKSLESRLNSEEDLDQRDQEYFIYRECLKTAYFNDEVNNLEAKITSDEKSILNTLAQTLDLSQEEVKLIQYSVLPLEKMMIDDLIDLLKSSGIILYHKKSLTVYIPDEFVRLLRKYRGFAVAPKYRNRILRLLSSPQINLICKKHNIDRKLDQNQKIAAIIKEGVGIRSILKFDIHKDGTLVSDKKKMVNQIVEKGLNFDSLGGSTIDAKIDILVDYFNELDKDDKVGISHEGFQNLVLDLSSAGINFVKNVRSHFELQDNQELTASVLLDFNIKPRDVLECLSEDDIKKFCGKMEISVRGSEVLNILDSYKNSSNIELENYELIASRNLLMLKENGISIKEADLGVKFEDLTKEIFLSLGFQVDEELRGRINTTKDKIDLLIKVDDSSVILVECKSQKEKGYNKFSSVSSQIRSYQKLLDKNGLRVLKSLLVAPDFSEDFISETEADYELNLSLIQAETLSKILQAFKAQKNIGTFPHQLFMRDVLISEDRIVKSISR